MCSSDLVGVSTSVAPSPETAASARASSTNAGSCTAALAAAPGRDDNVYAASEPSAIDAANIVSVNVIQRDQARGVAFAFDHAFELKLSSAT